MKTRNYLVPIIPVLWLSLQSPAAGATLATLAADFRQSPTPAKHAAIESYAAAHAADTEGALAHLVLGIVAWEQKDYRAALDALGKAQPKLPQIADYVAYYTAAAHADAKDVEGVARELSPVRSQDLRSPLAGRAWLVEARALSAGALRLLLDHYKELPQPEGSLALADAYTSEGDLVQAARTYQRVWCEYLSGDAAARAAAALDGLKQQMGPSYPAIPPAMLLRRADRLLESRQLVRARAEYQALVSKLTGPEHDQARIGIGAVDYLNNQTRQAQAYLRAIEVAPGEADAERLYYLVECARRLDNDEAMMSAVARLASEYPKSAWRLKALVTAANRYLLINRPDDYVPLYRAAFENFPSDPAAGLYHWKVAFQAYLRNAADSAQLLREHLLNYPSHNTAGAALYFLGRRAEQDGQLAASQAYYKRLADGLPNTYYAMLARERLSQPEVARETPAADAIQFAASLKIATARPVPLESAGACAQRIERSRLLRTAGLNDLADAELRFGARTDGQASVLAIELASAAELPHQAMRIMKTMSPDYLSLPLDQAPRKFWDLLFPLPYRGELEQMARGQGIDAFLLAGLIRQESEFNPQALSRAKAYGLTQIRPGTGRQYARAAGVLMQSPRQLFQPIINLKIGTSILRSMLDDNQGQVEQTLACYNAGPLRLAQWSTWNNYREPAEFVESIPFTETRDYVQAVLRNADIYRRLYR